MFGHSPPAVAQAIAAQAARGLTCHAARGESWRPWARGWPTLFGLPWWQLTQTATDANRAVLRLARMATGRPRMLVFDRCYHGTVDETLVIMGDDGSTLPRPGQIGRVHDPGATTVVVEFNDIAAVERALARGDIACVLAEPVMTNAGMVLPQPGFLEALRAACTRHDVLLAIDETHTLSSGRGGYARVHGLRGGFPRLRQGDRRRRALRGLRLHARPWPTRLRAADAHARKRALGHRHHAVGQSAGPRGAAASLAQLHDAGELRAHGRARGAACAGHRTLPAQHGVRLAGLARRRAAGVRSRTRAAHRQRRASSPSTTSSMPRCTCTC